MTIKEYLSLPESEKKKYQSDRVCEECGTVTVRDGHSIGNMHVVCPTCDSCFDCEDGAC